MVSRLYRRNPANPELRVYLLSLYLYFTPREQLSLTLSSAEKWLLAVGLSQSRLGFPVLFWLK